MLSQQFFMNKEGHNLLYIDLETCVLEKLWVAAPESAH